MSQRAISSDLRLRSLRIPFRHLTWSKPSAHHWPNLHEQDSMKTPHSIRRSLCNSQRGLQIGDSLDNGQATHICMSPHGHKSAPTYSVQCNRLVLHSCDTDLLATRQKSICWIEIAIHTQLHPSLFELADTCHICKFRHKLDDSVAFQTQMYPHSMSFFKVATVTRMLSML